MRLTEKETQMFTDELMLIQSTKDAVLKFEGSAAVIILVNRYLVEDDRYTELTQSDKEMLAVIASVVEQEVQYLRNKLSNHTIDSLSI
jgi:hypothetical protein